MVVFVAEEGGVGDHQRFEAVPPECAVIGAVDAAELAGGDQGGGRDEALPAHRAREGEHGTVGAEVADDPDETAGLGIEPPHQPQGVVLGLALVEAPDHFQGDHEGYVLAAILQEPGILHAAHVVRTERGRFFVYQRGEFEAARAAVVFQHPRQLQQTGHGRGVVVRAGRSGNAVVVRADHDGLRAGPPFFGDDVGNRPAVGRKVLARRCVAGGVEFGLDVLRGALQRISVPEVPLADVDGQMGDVSAEILR